MNQRQSPACFSLSDTVFFQRKLQLWAWRQLWWRFAQRQKRSTPTIFSPRSSAAFIAVYLPFSHRWFSSSCLPVPSLILNCHIPYLRAAALVKSVGHGWTSEAVLLVVIQPPLSSAPHHPQSLHQLSTTHLACRFIPLLSFCSPPFELFKSGLDRNSIPHFFLKGERRKVHKTVPASELPGWEKTLREEDETATVLKINAGNRLLEPSSIWFDYLTLKLTLKKIIK